MSLAILYRDYWRVPSKISSMFIQRLFQAGTGRPTQAIEPETQRAGMLCERCQDAVTTREFIPTVIGTVTGMRNLSARSEAAPTSSPFKHTRPIIADIPRQRLE